MNTVRHKSRNSVASLLAAMVLAIPLGVPAIASGQIAPKSETSHNTLSSEELYEKTLKATCWVVLPNCSGTGWVLDREKRLIITNYHVVDGFDEAQIYFAYKKADAVQTDPQWYRMNVNPIRAKVIDRSKERDLSLLQLESMPAGTAALPLATRSAKQGQDIMTIGAATRGSGGLWGWVDGKVRNVVEVPHYGHRMRQVESNISTNSGNSGGPVVNNHGELVAVHFACSVDARNVSYHIDLSELRSFLAVSLPLVEPKTVSGLIARGDRRLSESRFAMAREDFAAAVKLDPKNARARLGRGMATFFYGDNATAILDLDEALKLEPEYYKAVFYRGRARANMNKHEEAIADFTNAIRIEPKSVEAYNYRGCSQFELKKFDEAEADFNRAMDYAPTDPLYVKNRGLAREKQGKMDDAIADLEKAIELRPRDAKQFTALGQMLFRAKRYDDSIKMHLKADELDPTHHPIHAACVGDCLKEQGNWEKAVKLYTIALERSSKNLDGYRADICYCCRGYCLRRMENYDASLADHNRSLKINPNRAETYYQRAWTYRWLGQYNQAKEDYDKAVKLDADYASQEAPVVVRQGYNSGIYIRR